MTFLKNRLLKSFVSALALSFILVPSFIFTPVASAQITANDLWGNVNSVGNITGLGARDPREIAASVIKVVLGFLGIIAVLIIVYAGFLWMTAAGNDDKISTAKSMLSAGVTGLIIILAAFGIATFVVKSLVGATTT